VKPSLKTGLIIDTGPLVALLNRADGAHQWVLTQMQDMQPPFLTCEAVLAEASYLTREVSGARAALLEMVGEGFLRMGLQVKEQHAALLTLIKRYHSVPMSLADACLVRLAELHPQSAVFTLDSDFSIYRKNGRQAINQIRP
jgi:uncharacterized protein